MANKKLKNPQITTSSGKIRLEDPAIATIGDNGHPVFCFQHLHRDYNISETLTRDKKFPKGLLSKMETLTHMTWTQIKFSARTGAGAEKIPIDSLRKAPPATITGDVKEFLSFRFSGTDGRIIGYRGKDTIFHIVFIDTDLSVYSH